mmetsp:Transcript_3265/g.5127  ORF Transcript_3265/g.5127 Transcript_3265/m.5127 type:complete len:294 (+) Transcript_3265:76-957(+)
MQNFSIALLIFTQCFNEVSTLSFKPPTTCAHSRMYGTTVGNTPEAFLYKTILHASTEPNNDEKDLDVGEIYSNPLTSFLGNFIGSKDEKMEIGDKEQEKIVQLDDFTKPKAFNLPIGEMVKRLDAGIRENEWFVTGKVMSELFADDFLFKDPDVQLRGIEKYADGVNRLFDQNTSRVEVISCELNPAITDTVNKEMGASIDDDKFVQVVTVEWRLSGNVNIGPFGGLFIKPYICYSDLHVRNADGLIVYQEDRFDIPGWDILLSAIAPWLPFLAPPAPSVSVILQRKADDGNN